MSPYSYPSSISVNAAGQITSMTAGPTPTTGTVTSVNTTSAFTVDGTVAGTITTTGTLDLNPTGVDPSMNPYSYPSSISVNAAGQITSMVGGISPGTVTSVGTTSLFKVSGMVGGTITTTGMLDLNVSGVTPNTYTLSNITVNPQGQVTFAANGAVVTNTTLTGTGQSSSPLSVINPLIVSYVTADYTYVSSAAYTTVNIYAMGGGGGGAGNGTQTMLGPPTGGGGGSGFLSTTQWPLSGATTFTIVVGAGGSGGTGGTTQGPGGNGVASTVTLATGSYASNPLVLLSGGIGDGSTGENGGNSTLGSGGGAGQNSDISGGTGGIGGQGNGVTWVIANGAGAGYAAGSNGGGVVGGGGGGGIGGGMGGTRRYRKFSGRRKWNCSWSWRRRCRIQFNNCF